MLHETNVPPEMELKSEIEINWKLSREGGLIDRLYSAIGINWFNLPVSNYYISRPKSTAGEINENLSRNRENGECRSRTSFHGEIRECWHRDTLTRTNLCRGRSAVTAGERDERRKTERAQILYEPASSFGEFLIRNHGEILAAAPYLAT